MAMRISVIASKELQQTIALLKGMEKEASKYIRQVLKAELQAEWQEAMRGETRTAQEVRVLSDTARVAVSNQNVTLKTASVGRSLSGGYKPSELWAAVEFGSNQTKTDSYTSHSRKGKAYTVHNRHTNRQFRKRNWPKGYVFFPAAQRVIPKVAALYFQTTVRTFYELFEKGGLR